MELDGQPPLKKALRALGDDDDDNNNGAPAVQAVSPLVAPPSPLPRPAGPRRGDSPIVAGPSPLSLSGGSSVDASFPRALSMSNFTHAYGSNAGLNQYLFEGTEANQELLARIAYLLDENVRLTVENDSLRRELNAKK